MRKRPEEKGYLLQLPGPTPSNFPRNPLSLTNTLAAKNNPELIQVKPVVDNPPNEVITNFTSDWNDFKKVLKKGEVACAVRPEFLTEKGLLNLIDEQIDVTNRLYHKIERASDEALKGMVRVIQEDDDPGLKKRADPQLLESLVNLGRGTSNVVGDFRWDQEAFRSQVGPISPVRFAEGGGNSLLDTLTAPINRHPSNTLGNSALNLYPDLDTSFSRNPNDNSFDGLYLRSRQTSQTFMPLLLTDKEAVEPSRKGSEDLRRPPLHASNDLQR